MMVGRQAFLDMNSFFASVEQQERAELRGRPVIVVPLDVDSTCAIAASYEAKALGIKTGTSVRAAKRICPGIAVVPARPELYVQYHAGVVDVLNQFFVHIKVLSVDEMACGINRLHSSEAAERKLALDVKRAVQVKLGEGMRCSVGIAPNVFLAKVASDRQKPDGLTVYRMGDVPHALYSLDLLDLPGIGAGMLARLERFGIHTVRQLYGASAIDLRRAWGSVVGERWWYMMRGSLEADYGGYGCGTSGGRKSVSHSHVLPPEFRTEAGARQIVLRLFAKALARLRRYEMAASSIEVWVKFQDEATYVYSVWKRRSGKHLHANDDLTWMQTLKPLLATLPEARRGHDPAQAGVVFGGLLARRDVNLSLFPSPHTEKGEALSDVVDAANGRRKGSVGMSEGYLRREEAPFRLAFGQTQLVFSE